MRYLTAVLARRYRAGLRTHFSGVNSTSDRLGSGSGPRNPTVPGRTLVYLQLLVLSLFPSSSLDPLPSPCTVPLRVNVSALCRLSHWRSTGTKLKLRSRSILGIYCFSLQNGADKLSSGTREALGLTLVPLIIFGEFPCGLELNQQLARQ